MGHHHGIADHVWEKKERMENWHPEPGTSGYTDGDVNLVECSLFPKYSESYYWGSHIKYRRRCLCAFWCLAAAAASGAAHKHLLLYISGSIYSAGVPSFLLPNTQPFPPRLLQNNHPAPVFADAARTTRRDFARLDEVKPRGFRR